MSNKQELPPFHPFGFSLQVHPMSEASGPLFEGLPRATLIPRVATEVGARAQLMLEELLEPLGPGSVMFHCPIVPSRDHQWPGVLPGCGRLRAVLTSKHVVTTEKTLCELKHV